MNIKKKLRMLKGELEPIGTRLLKGHGKKMSISYHEEMNVFDITYPTVYSGSIIVQHLFGNILKYKHSGKRPGNYEIFNFEKELEKMGYDIRTLKFSVELKAKPKG